MGGKTKSVVARDAEASGARWPKIAERRELRIEVHDMGIGRQLELLWGGFPSPM